MNFSCDKGLVRAAKQHDCWYCGHSIQIGETYGKRVGSTYGDFWTMRFHPECDDWANENWSVEEWESHSPGDEFERPLTAFDPCI